MDRDEDDPIAEEDDANVEMLSPVDDEASELLDSDAEVAELGSDSGEAVRLDEPAVPVAEGP